jgi:zinc D-Ala-D-Ala carboxypeptidase
VSTERESDTRSALLECGGLTTHVRIIDTAPPTAGSALAAAAAMAMLLFPGGAAADPGDGLDPVLGASFALASDAARAAGIPLWITSGGRTPAEQEQLWRDGLVTYGSPEAARRWVLPPNESTHVGGHAIDVGPRAGAAWLEATGFRWGLCRTFANEWWHFEVTTIPGRSCPPMWPDAATRGYRELIVTW